MTGSGLHRILIVAALSAGAAACASSPSPPGGRPDASAGGGGARLHAVQPGDTLSGLAVRYGVPVEVLAAANGLGPPYTIYVGEPLLVPGGAGGRVQTYVVRPGDTLSGIAARLGTTARALAVASGIDEPDRIRAGQVLVVPADGAVPRRMAARAPTRRPSGAPSLLLPVRGGEVVAGFAEAGGGLEIVAAERRAPVRAVADGVVVFAGRGPNGVAGVVVLRHEDGGVGVYAHADELLVGVGDRVRRGAVIARLPDRERPRLRFELREGGARIDPAPRLLPEGGAERPEADAGGRNPEPPALALAPPT